MEKRLVAYLDPWAEAPDDDMVPPRMAWGWDGWSYRVTAENDPDETIPVASVERLVNRHGAQPRSLTWRVLARWSRIFHGFDMVRYPAQDQGDAEKVFPMPLKPWREKLELSDTWEYSIEDDVYHHYRQGEVYYIRHERLVRWTSEDGRTRDEWETTDSLHGLYGRKWLAEALKEEALEGESVYVGKDVYLPDFETVPKN